MSSLFNLSPVKSGNWCVSKCETTVDLWVLIQRHLASTRNNMSIVGFLQGSPIVGSPSRKLPILQGILMGVVFLVGWPTIWGHWNFPWCNLGYEVPLPGCRRHQGWHYIFGISWTKNPQKSHWYKEGETSQHVTSVSFSNLWAIFKNLPTTSGERAHFRKQTNIPATRKKQTSSSQLPLNWF